MKLNVENKIRTDFCDKKYVKLICEFNFQKKYTLRLKSKYNHKFQ